MKPEFKFIWLALVIVLSGCASVLNEDGALAISPYKIQQNGRIVIDVQVNDQGPFVFALDTGASISVVFDEFRNKLGLEVVPGKVAMIHGLAASSKVPLVSISRLEVGREVWVEPRIASLPGDTDADTGIEGILGVDFLHRYAVGFSARDNVIRLYPPDLVAGRSYRGWSTIRLVPEYIGASGAALYLFEIEIHGHDFPAIFDLGSGLNLLNWAAAQTIGIAPKASREKDVLAGAIETMPIPAYVRIDQVKSGRVRWQNEEFRIVGSEVLTNLMDGDTAYALLGAGFFTQRDFIIDFTRNRLLVKVAMD